MRGRRGRYGGALAGAALAVAFAASRARAAAPEVANGPWVQRVTPDSALVRVEVDPPGPVTLELGVAEESERQTLQSTEARAVHSIPVKGLRPKTRYVYEIRAGETTKSASFVTAPPESGDEPFRFLVYGDNRSDDVAHAAVVRAMTPVPADLLVHTGDFVADGASSAQWRRFFEIEAPLLGTRSLYSAVGNHELTDGAGLAYIRYFGPTDMRPGADGGTSSMRPEHLNGTFRWGNTRFFLINGMVSYDDGRVDRAWLERALADAAHEAALTWRVVVTHHGPWSSGPHGGNARLLDSGVVGLLEAYGVDLVLAGHDHIYERGFGRDERAGNAPPDGGKRGIAYVISGGGGAPTYRIRSRSPQAQTVESVHHFVDMAVSASSMQLTAIRADGSTIERCALVKGHDGWDCEEGPSSSSSPAPAAPAPPAATPMSTSRCSCDAAGAPVSGLAALAGACVVGAALAGRRRAWRRDAGRRY